MPRGLTAQALRRALTALVIACCAASPAHAESLDFARSAAVVAGVLEWDDPDLEDFDKDGRKDQALATLLVKRGLPKDRLRTLLDAKATRKSFLDAVGAMAKVTPRGGWLIVYFAGHGIQLDDGRIGFALSDARDATIESTGLLLRDLSATLVRAVPKGRRVLLLADACYSGGLGEVAAALAQRGVPAVALTSSEASNDSTVNWTYTQTLLEVLSGSALADGDGDGTLTLDEAVAEVRGALLYRERQRAGYRAVKVAGSLELARVTQRPGRTGKLPRGFTQGGYATVDDEVVRVLGTKGRQVRVSYFDYSERTEETVSPRRLRPIRFQTFKVGQKLQVLWEDECWDAEVVRVDGPFHFITYPEWEHTWDEWVTDDRIVSGREKCPPPKKK